MSLPFNLEDIALSLMEGLACARSVTVAILIRHREWDQLTSLSVDPRHYCDSEDYFNAAAATGFLKKYPKFKLNIDVEEEARADFLQSERDCFRARERLDPFLYNAYPAEDEAISYFISRCRKIIKRILGPVPNNERFYRPAFGPGATLSDPSVRCMVTDKITSVPTLTPDAWIHARDLMSSAWGRALREEIGVCELREVPGNTFFTVPKTARKLRGCGLEPSVNVYYQLAEGRLIKKRLLRWGLDLKKAKGIHVDLARKASVDGLFATIDLSRASDTISHSLVRLLLPKRWYERLASLRSPTTSVDGRINVLDKFSSMGNGYTFELETMLFAVIAKVACNEEVTPGRDLFVFGDDIIVPTIHSRAVIAALRFFGFSINDLKSFTEGSFRESCGGDFFDGVGVRPFYLEDEPSEPQHYIALANGLWRMGHQHGAPPSRALALRPAWNRVLACLPSHIRRLRGPRELEDAVIHSDESEWRYRWKDSIRYFKAYTPTTYTGRVDSRRGLVRWEGYGRETQYAAALYGVQLHEGRYLVPRNPLMSYDIRWLPSS